MPALNSEESVTENQTGLGLKILMLNAMLIRLPINLTQLQTAKYSQKTNQIKLNKHFIHYIAQKTNYSNLL